MITPNDVFLSDYCQLKKKFKGYLENYPKPGFPANTWVFGNLYGNVHFMYCMN
jgi:hypothetical protein